MQWVATKARNIHEPEAAEMGRKWLETNHMPVDEIKITDYIHYVGRRVLCWWDEPSTWFYGTITECEVGTGWLLIEYDDGDREFVMLPDPTVIVLAYDDDNK